MSLVLVDIDSETRVATVTLNDPDRRNVFTNEMNKALIPVVAELESDDGVGAMVITGAGPHFSAGGHLDDLLNATSNEEMHDIYSGFLRVAHSTLATVAAVNGAAVGAGMNCALACDLIIAGEKSRFDSRFLQIAIHPGGGHTWRLRNKTDIQTAKAMVLFSEVLFGPQAKEVGLAWDCVADDQILARAQELAAKAAGAPKELVARTKASLNSSYAITESQASVDLEVDPQVWSMAQQDFKDLVARLKANIAAKK